VQEQSNNHMTSQREHLFDKPIDYIFLALFLTRMARFLTNNSLTLPSEV